MITEVIAIYNDDIRGMKEEFKQEFNRITEEKFEGWLAFYFSRYIDYTIRTEVVYCYMYKETALFYVNPCTMVLKLSNELQVNDGDILNNGDIFLRMFWDEENPELELIDDVCNMRGNYFGVFSFKYPKALSLSIDIMKTGRYNIDLLSIDEDDMTEISLDYLDERIQKFETQVDKSFELEEPVSGLDDNPLSNEFYDAEYGSTRKRRKKPLNNSRYIGDNNV